MIQNCLSVYSLSRAIGSVWSSDGIAIIVLDKIECSLMLGCIDMLLSGANVVGVGFGMTLLDISF